MLYNIMCSVPVYIRVRAHVLVTWVCIYTSNNVAGVVIACKRGVIEPGADAMS